MLLAKTRQTKKQVKWASWDIKVMCFAGHSWRQAILHDLTVRTSIWSFRHLEDALSIGSLPQSRSSSLYYNCNEFFPRRCNGFDGWGWVCVFAFPHVCHKFSHFVHAWTSCVCAAACPLATKSWCVGRLPWDHNYELNSSGSQNCNCNGK